MTATAAISTLRTQLRHALASNELTRVRRWAESAKRWLMEWVNRVEERSPLAPDSVKCPGALPGFNQDVVVRTWQLSRQRAPYSDGRQRLAGEHTLDICATPQHIGRAIASFACWLDYLAADGIGVEIRKVDAWRTCAMVNGVPVPIRIRERMRRVSGANRLSARLERFLGGHIPSVLVPSGRLELQLLRMGVAFASFPLPEMPTPGLLEAVSRSIRAMATREVEYRERMHAAAVAETASRRSHTEPSRSHTEPRRTGSTKRGSLRSLAPESPAGMGQEVAADPLMASQAEITLLSIYSATRLAQILESLQRSLGEASGVARQRQDGMRESAADGDARQMVESMVSLAKAMQLAGPTREAALATPNGVALITEGTPKSIKSRRGRRSRVA